MASLRELQHAFAAALRDPARACAVSPAANLAVYRNTAGVNFREAIAQTFPVVRRRVGDDYFRQLCSHYRDRFPSRSGDLHWAGRDFAAFLHDYLAGGDYAWLADLARLEWSRAECLVATELPALEPSALARFSADDLERLIFGLQPALRLHESAFPVFTVWLTNQIETAPPVDQSIGREHGMVRLRHDGVEIRKLDAGRFSFLSALSRGATLGDAVSVAALDDASLAEALKFVFVEGVVTSLALRATS